MAAQLSFLAQDCSAQPGTFSAESTVKQLQQAARCLQRDNNLDSKNMNPAQLFVLIYKQDTNLCSFARENCWSIYCTLG